MIVELKNSIRAWYNKPINPVFLELRDQKLHQMFQSEARKSSIRRFVILAALLTIMNIYYVIDYWNELHQKAYFILMTVVVNV